MTYVWIFFTIVFGLYALLLFAKSDKILPDSFKKNMGHPYFDTWRLFAGAGYLVIASGCALWALSENQQTLALGWTLRGVGILMWALGLVIVFFFNRKDIRLFNPGFYKIYEEELNEKKKKKELKKKQKEMKRQQKNKNSLEG
jgi:hypothetical protein